MATVEVFNKARTKAIEDAALASASVDANGHLILVRANGDTVDAGYVVGNDGLPGADGSTQIHVIAPIGIAMFMPIDGPAPDGCVKYDGATYLKADMPALWAFLSQSTTINYEVDATHFKVPDMTDVVPVGAGDTFNPIGSVIGEAEVTLTAAQSGLPAHFHPYRYGNTAGDGSGLQFSGTIGIQPVETGIRKNTGVDAAEPHTNVQPSFVGQWVARYEEITFAPAGSLASVSATGDRVVQRTSDGRAKVSDPVDSSDVDTKGARDAAIALARTVPPQGQIPSAVVVGSGSASVADDGTVTFTGCSSIALDGVFTGTPGEVYQIFIRSTGTAANYQFIRTRNGGVTRTSADHNRIGVITSSSSGPSRSTQFGDTVLCYIYPASTAAPSINAQLVWHTPNVAGLVSQVRVHSMIAASDRFMWEEYGQGNKGDGFILACTAGTATGTIKVVKMV